MRGRAGLLLLAVIGLLSLAGYAALWAAHGAPRAVYLILLGGLFALYLLACYLILRCRDLPARPTLILIAGGAVLARAILVPADPALSDDIYRYVWDGRVQAAGLSPYAYAPAAPQLAALHPPRDPIWPRINRKGAITIYPPGAELFFAGLYRWQPDSITATKAALVGMDLLSCLVLALLLARLGLAPTRVLIYAWAPLPIFEFGSSGHVEALEVLLTLLALLAGVEATRQPGARRRSGAAALAVLALAGAALVKLIPLLLLAAWARRLGPARILLALALFGSCYLLFVAAHGWHISPFLITYLRDEYVNAPVYSLLAYALGPLGVPDGAIRAALLVALGLVALGVARQRDWDRDAFVGKSFALVAAYLLLATSAHPWYATWLLLFVPLFLPPRGLGPAGPRRARVPVFAALAVGALLYTGLTVWGGYPTT